MEFPLISIVVSGNSSLKVVKRCLDQLKGLEYPKDQLEYLLILPHSRPFPDNHLKLRIIRFDESLPWSTLNARTEGLSFTRGEYVQFLDSDYFLHPKWLKKGLSYFVHHQMAGVIGRIHDTNQQQTIPGSLSQTRAPKVNLLKDGLYDAIALKNYFFSNHGKKISNPSDFFLPEKVIRIEDLMSVANQDDQLVLETPQYSGSRLMTLLTKFISPLLG